MSNKKILVVGGGAAGYFAALRAATCLPEADIVIAEAGTKPLQKVSISGGGRCNVTHSCFDPKELVKAYPRGYRELLGPFNHFQPKDTENWFLERGVLLHAEDDGRMFPVSNSSETIIACFEREREKLGVQLLLSTKVISISKRKGFDVVLKCKKETSTRHFDLVVLASGNGKAGYEIARTLDHTIVPLVPSLFTFQIKDTRLEGLSGVSVPDAETRLVFSKKKKFFETGPLLITNWGLSGPAVIKLSAWAARELFDCSYTTTLNVNWVPKSNQQNFTEQIQKAKKESTKKAVRNVCLAGIPKRLWESVCRASNVSDEITYADISKKSIERMSAELFDAQYQITGKGVFKEEFVTCGGVSLKEVDFRTMESKRTSGLYFAGEVLDIDGITGGYNFQSAWTTGFIAGTLVF